MGSFGREGVDVTEVRVGQLRFGEGDRLQHRI